MPRAPGPGAEPRCEVELTEVHTNGQDWWTLGFEVTGPAPADLLRSELRATAALVFANAMPGGVQPGPDGSRSYAQWLYQRPGRRHRRCRLKADPRAAPAGPPFCSPRPGASPTGNASGGMTAADHIEAVRLALASARQARPVSWRT